MFCRNDGIENREGAKLCKKCGSCLNCGEKNPGQGSCRVCRIPLSDTSQKMCPRGHPLAKGSEHCDICDGNATGTIRPIDPTTQRRGPTLIDEPIPAPVYGGAPLPPVQPQTRNRPKTQFFSASAEEGRRIVGVLITYSRKKEGELFPVREGRNLIGSDPEKCDIAIETDRAMTGIHAHITFRRSFVVGDRGSFNGTYLDEEPIESEFVPLRNYARIRTGATVWTFVAIPSDKEPVPSEG